MDTSAAEAQPEIVSEAAIVLDYDTGEIIYEKNANNKMFLASTTKLMTAILFAENKSKEDTITYTESAKAQPPYTMDSEQMAPYGKSMQIGDTLSADTVMKELLLFSANDSAYMIADAVSGNSNTFVELMNKKATEYGLKNTHFSNPNGLPVNGNDVNYSTAYELAIITKHAYDNQWIKETMQLSEANVVLPGDTRIKLENRNTELNKNGNIGGKTGVTNQAGTCFAGVYERNGIKLIGVVLKCDRNDNNKRFEDLNSMMNYSYPAQKVPFKSAGTEVSTVELSYKLFKFFGPTKTISVPVTLSEDATIYDTETNKSNAKISFDDIDKNAWDVANNNEVTLKLTVLNSDTNIKGQISLTTSQILKDNIFAYAAVVAILLIIILLIVFITKLIKGSSNKKARRRR